MAFVQPNVLLMLFRRFNAGQPITAEAVQKFDAQLKERLEQSVLAALAAANVNDTSAFAVATVVGTALLAMGGADQLVPAAHAYKRALDTGIIG